MVTQRARTSAHFDPNAVTSFVACDLYASIPFCNCIDTRQLVRFDNGVVVTTTHLHATTMSAVERAACELLRQQLSMIRYTSYCLPSDPYASLYTPAEPPERWSDVDTSFHFEVFTETTESADGSSAEPGSTGRSCARMVVHPDTDPPIVQTYGVNEVRHVQCLVGPQWLGRAPPESIALDVWMPVMSVYVPRLTQALHEAAHGQPQCDKVVDGAPYMQKYVHAKMTQAEDGQLRVGLLLRASKAGGAADAPPAADGRPSGVLPFIPRTLHHLLPVLEPSILPDNGWSSFSGGPVAVAREVSQVSVGEEAAALQRQLRAGIHGLGRCRFLAMLPEEAAKGYTGPRVTRVQPMDVLVPFASSDDPATPGSDLNTTAGFVGLARAINGFVALCKERSADTGVSVDATNFKAVLAPAFVEYPIRVLTKISGTRPQRVANLWVPQVLAQHCNTVADASDSSSLSYTQTIGGAPFVRVALVYDGQAAPDTLAAREPRGFNEVFTELVQQLLGEAAASYATAKPTPVLRWYLGTREDLRQQHDLEEPCILPEEIGGWGPPRLETDDWLLSPTHDCAQAVFCCACTPMDVDAEPCNLVTCGRDVQQAVNDARMDEEWVPPPCRGTVTFRMIETLICGCVANISNVQASLGPMVGRSLFNLTAACWVDVECLSPRQVALDIAIGALMAAWALVARYHWNADDGTFAVVTQGDGIVRNIAEEANAPLMKAYRAACDTSKSWAAHLVADRDWYGIDVRDNVTNAHTRTMIGMASDVVMAALCLQLARCVSPVVTSVSTQEGQDEHLAWIEAPFLESVKALAAAVEELTSCPIFLSSVRQFSALFEAFSECEDDAILSAIADINAQDLLQYEREQEQHKEDKKARKKANKKKKGQQTEPEAGPNIQVVDMKDPTVARRVRSTPLQLTPLGVTWPCDGTGRAATASDTPSTSVIMETFQMTSYRKEPTVPAVMPDTAVPAGDAGRSTDGVAAAAGGPKDGDGTPGDGQAAVASVAVSGTTTALVDSGPGPAGPVEPPARVTEPPLHATDQADAATPIPTTQTERPTGSSKKNDRKLAKAKAAAPSVRAAGGNNFLAERNALEKEYTPASQLAQPVLVGMGGKLTTAAAFADSSELVGLEGGPEGLDWDSNGPGDLDLASLSAASADFAQPRRSDGPGGGAGAAHGQGGQPDRVTGPATGPGAATAAAAAPGPESAGAGHVPTAGPALWSSIAAPTSAGTGHTPQLGTLTAPGPSSPMDPATPTASQPGPFMPGLGQQPQQQQPMATQPQPQPQPQPGFMPSGPFPGMGPGMPHPMFGFPGPGDPRMLMMMQAQLQQSMMTVQGLQGAVAVLMGQLQEERRRREELEARVAALEGRIDDVMPPPR